MFSHLSRLFKHSVLYGLSETVSRGTSFILVFIYVRNVLTDSEIGIRSSLYFASLFIGILYTLGLDNAFLRYFMDEDFTARKRALFSSSLYFTSFIGFVFFGITLLNSEWVSSIITESDAYVYITRLLFIIVIFDTVVEYPMLVLRAENRIFYYTFISFSRFFLFITLNLLLVWYLHRGVNGVFEANLLVVLIVFLLLFPVYKQYFSGRLSFNILNKMLVFGVPTIFMVLAMRVIDYSDRRIILHYLGEAPLGQYTIAYNLGMVGIMVFVNSFRTAWQPFFLSLKTNPDAKVIYSRVATYYAVFISFIFMGIVLYRNEIFHLYAPSKPVALSDIIPFIALSYILYGFYLIMLPGIFIREKTKYLPFATFIGAVVNIVLNFLFIPAFGIIGAAYATIIAYAAMDVVLYCIAKYVYNVRYEIGRIGLVFLFIFVPIGVSLLYTPEEFVIKFLYNFLLCFIPFLIYHFSDFFSSDERAYINRIVKKFRLHTRQH